ncbi:MAG: hypothetical protein K0S09_1849 [Sphingobacteriaceae bacterium]|nr:hypothetical protein [Sphingobacteriaceae bacterium]
MSFEVYFDSPENYKNKYNFYAEGSSPLLLARVIELLEVNKDELAEVCLGFYLFNNKILYQKLLELANMGVKVSIVTIPPEGYDDSNPKFITDRATGAELNYATKYQLAREIFADCYRRPHPNLNLYFFPHQYIRSARAKAFSRGSLPYSLHLKSILLNFKNSSGVVGISSSNFAVRDLIKEELLVFAKDEPEYANATQTFFADLLNYSINIRDYNFKHDYCSYGTPVVPSPTGKVNGFIAPFYQDSSFGMEDFVAEKIRSAKSKIYICGQHVCPISYQFNGSFHSGYGGGMVSRNGWVPAIIERASAGADVMFISQTFASGKLSAGDRTPANRNAFSEFFGLISEVPNIRYYVNENLHSKFILIDEEVIVSTFNYTPSQFIYLDKVVIEKFESNPDKSYEGVFSEVGQYMVIDDAAVVTKFRAYVETLIQLKASVKKLY